MLQSGIFFFILVFSNYCESFILYRKYQNETNFIQSCITNEKNDRNWALAMVPKLIRDYIPLGSKYEHGDYIDNFNNSTNEVVKNANGRSIRYNLPHVLDKRWEDFDTVKLDPNTKFIKKLGNGITPILHLSLLFEGEIEVTIHSGTYSWCAFLHNSVKIVQLVFNGCNSALNEDVNSEETILWRHYTIYLSEKRAYMLQESAEFNGLSPFPINIDAIEFSSTSKAFLKIHDYNFLVLDKTKTEVFPTPIFPPKGNEHLGVCMYIYANNKCEVKLSIEGNNTESTLSEKKYIGEGRWILENIDLKKTNEPMQLIIERIGFCEMVYLDDIRYCTKDERRKLVYHSKRKSDSCTTMGNKTVIYSDPYPLLQNDLVYDKYKHFHDGENLVICTENSFCFCSPGHVGVRCEKDISHFMNILEINPTTILIHIKDIGFYNWSYVIINAQSESHEKSFNITLPGYNYTYEIDNLQMNSIYNLTAKYCTSEDCTYFQNIPLLIKTKKCIDIKEENIIHTTTPYSILLNARNLTKNHCQLDNYALYINTTELGSFSNSKEINNLLPNSLYTVTLSTLKHGKNKRETEFLLTLHIKTDSRKASSVNNLQIMNITTKSAKLNFKPPTTSYEKIIQYQIKYSIIRYQACENNSHSYEKIVYVDSSALTVDLIELEPYAEYGVEICALTDSGCGTEIRKTFKTEGYSKFITNEETILHIDEKSLKFTFPVCEMVKGNITYTIIATCHEIYCEEDNKLLTFNYQLRNNYKQINQHLRPYTNYELYLILKRNNDKKYVLRKTIKTAPGKPNPVVNLTAYAHTNESISLRWKPPHVSTGIIEYYRIETCLNDICNNVTCNKSCSLWDGHICEDIHNLIVNEVYDIFVYAKNLNSDSISDGQMVKAVAFEYAPGRPRNLEAEYLWHGPVVLSWLHPERTNGLLQCFEIYIYSDKILVSQEIIQVKTYQAVYTHQINYLSYYKSYEVFVKAKNTFLGPQSNTVTIRFSLYYKAQLLWIALIVIVLMPISVVIWMSYKRMRGQPNYLRIMNSSLEFSSLEMGSARKIHPEPEPMNAYIDGYKGKKMFRLTDCDLKTIKGQEILRTEILRDKCEVLIFLEEQDNEILDKYENEIKVFSFDISKLSQIPHHITQMKTLMKTYAKRTGIILIHSRMPGNGWLFAKCFNMICGMNISEENLSQNRSKNNNDYGSVFYHYYKNQRENPPYLENDMSKLKDKDVNKYLISIEDLNRRIYYLSHVRYIKNDTDQSETQIKRGTTDYVVRNLELLSLKPGTGNPKLIVLLGSSSTIQDVVKQVLSVDNKIFVYTTVINGHNVPVIQWVYENPFVEKNQEKFYIFYYYYTCIIKHFHPEEIHIYSRDVSSGVIIASDIFSSDLSSDISELKLFDMQKVIYTMMYDFRQFTVEYVGLFLFNLFRKYWKSLKNMTDTELNFDIKSYFPETRTEINQLLSTEGTEVTQRSNDIISAARARNIQFSDPVGGDKKNS